MYTLSKFIPVFMHSQYRTDFETQKATWWQFRGRIFNHKFWTVS